MTDFDLERSAHRLGQHQADSLDVERLAAHVVQRLRQRRPWWQAPSLLRAAAVVALLGGGVVLGRVAPWQHQSGAVEIRTAVMPFEGLSTADLSEVLDSMRLEAPPSSYPRGLHDLSESQLRELLSLES